MCITNMEAINSYPPLSALKLNLMLHIRQYCYSIKITLNTIIITLIIISIIKIIIKYHHHGDDHCCCCCNFIPFTINPLYKSGGQFYGLLSNMQKIISAQYSIPSVHAMPSTLRIIKKQFDIYRGPLTSYHNSFNITYIYVYVCMH